MRLSADYEGFQVEVISLALRGGFGYRYEVAGFPRVGRGFRAKLAEPKYSSEHDALRAAFEVAKAEIQTFSAISNIESTVDSGTSVETIED